MAGTHLIFGAFCYAATTETIFSEPIGIIGLTASALGSLLPDIDHPKSFLGRRVRFLSVPISATLGHRGLTHSLIAIILFSMFLASFAESLPSVITALCIGYLSHLLGDFMTKGGIPLFYPIRARIRMPFAFRTGGKTEMVLGGGMLIYLIYPFFF